MSDRTTAAADSQTRVRSGAIRALRVLEACPMLPADAFGPMVGLASGSGAYKQLARLRSQGLADVRDEDLGFLFGDRRRGLWSITDLGRRALRDVSEQRDPDRLARDTRQQQRLQVRHLPLRVACYRLLAWFLVQGREQGDAYVVQGWESPWVAEFHPAEHDRPVRVKLPAAAYVISQSEPHPSLSSRRRLLLLPDLGTAPVARHGEVLRRLFIHNEQVKGRPGESDELLVVTPDPDGRGTRMAAWCELLARVARRQQAEPPPSRVLSWARVSARVGGPATSALVAVGRNGAAPGHLGRSDRAQVLHLLGRHPLLTMGQLARLLGTTRGRIEGFEREMIDLGWLRTLDLGDLGVSGLDLGEFASLGLVELTNVGRRRLADMLGLDSPTASRYHGLTGSGLAWAARRRRLLRALAHTLGTNDVFVAFALAAAEARRRGYVDWLSEWRGAAACERRRCKPDGYGLYTRNGVGYGFLLEYDRGTESARKYAAKFRAYYHYRDSGQAARDYNGLPTILFVTTSTSAEDRIADQAHRAWFIRGTDPLAVLITSTDRIAAHREGILGPIWRTPALAHGTLDIDRHYWLPGGSPHGVFGRERKRLPMPPLVWPAGHAGDSVVARRSREVVRDAGDHLVISNEQRSTKPIDQPPERLDYELELGEGLSSMEKATPTTSITLTLPGAARLLGVSETLARQMARAGRFPGAFQLGRAWRVHRQTFDEEVARLARGLPLEHVEDQILSRALDEVRFRHGSAGGR